MHRLPAQELPYDPNQVTPGVIGFAVTALIAIAIMLLLWDFNRRVRRINDRAEAKERLQAEIAAASSPRDAGAAEVGTVPGVESSTPGASAGADADQVADGAAVEAEALEPERRRDVEA